MGNYLPDFGTYLRENANPEAAFSSASIPITELARVAEDLFSITMTMPHMGQAFALTIDFARPQFLEFLELMPKELADQLAEHFSTPFEAPQMVNLPIPVDVGIDAKLGEENVNGEESYVPLVATAMRSAG